MKRTVTAIAAAGLIAGLSACGGSASASGSDVGGSREDALKETAQGYYDAMLAGNVIGMSAYYPKGCEDAGMLMFGAAMLKDMLAGVDRLKVTEVEVNGTVGKIVDGEMEGEPSAATKRLFEESGDSGEDEDIWNYVDGKWYVPCDSDTQQTDGESAA